MGDSEQNYFRTTDVATVPTSVGTLQMMTVKSPALKGRADLTLYVPDQAKGRANVPVVILLHGVYGSHWGWALKGQAHVTLQRLIDEGAIEPMIVAMPSDGLWGDGSGYVPHISQDFEQWIVEDVPQAVHVATGNALGAPHCIAGLINGGLRCAAHRGKVSSALYRICRAFIDHRGRAIGAVCRGGFIRVSS